jgi:hypothetical protein
MLVIIICIAVSNPKPVDTNQPTTGKSDISETQTQSAEPLKPTEKTDISKNETFDFLLTENVRPISEYFENRVPEIFSKTNDIEKVDTPQNTVASHEETPVMEKFETDEYIMYNCVPNAEKQVTFDDTHHITGDMICEKIKYTLDMITEDLEYQIYTEFDNQKIYLNHFLSSSCNEFIHLSPIPSLWKVRILGDNEVLMSNDKFLLVPSRLKNPVDSMNSASVESSPSCSSINTNTVVVDKEMFKDDSTQENILMISPESDNCGNDLVKDCGWLISRTLTTEPAQDITVVKENQDLYILRENSKLILNKCPTEKSYIYETFNSVVNYKHVKKTSIDVSISTLKPETGTYSKWRFEKFNREKTKFEPEYVKSHIIEQLCLV